MEREIRAVGLSGISVKGMDEIAWEKEKQAHIKPTVLQSLRDDEGSRTRKSEQKQWLEVEEIQKPKGGFRRKDNSKYLSEARKQEHGFGIWGFLGDLLSKH